MAIMIDIARLYLIATEEVQKLSQRGPVNFELKLFIFNVVYLEHRGKSPI